MKVNMKNETNSSDDMSDSDVEFAPSISSKPAMKETPKKKLSTAKLYTKHVTRILTEIKRLIERLFV